jgi:hypothetical protein
MSESAQLLRLRIQAQIELVAELICTDRDAVNAYRRLEKLTCILAKQELDAAMLDDQNLF